jgi:hypothetical protein
LFTLQPSPSPQSASFVITKVTVSSLAFLIVDMVCRNLCERVARINGYNGSLYELGLKYCKKHVLFSCKQIITEKTTVFAVVKYCVPAPGMLTERIERDVQNAIEG